MAKVKAALLLILSTSLCLVAAEFAVRQWVSRLGNPLQRARLVLEKDPVLGWRQRTNLTAIFEGKALVTDGSGFRVESQGKSEDPEIVVLGPSSAFGWGVDYKDTYAAALENLSGRKILNAGQIGYSLYQGEKLFASHFSRLEKAEWFVLAYGVNDLDHFRFFGESGLSDAKHGLKSPPGFLGRSALMGLLDSITREMEFSCGFRVRPQLRVPIAEFETILAAIADRLKRAGRKLALIDTAENYKIESDPQKADLSEKYYAESFQLGLLGRCKEARKMLSKARELESFRVKRDIAVLNERLTEFSLRTGTPLVRASKLLTRDDEFVDPIHPSAAGHAEISRHLHEIIR